MNNGVKEIESKWTVTRNACKACAPLGACLAVSGLEAGLNLLHGSQGCATYIRRYMISHFREPMDIASSSFSEESAVYGGKENLMTALDNVITQYHPKIIGLTSTCLAETMGEDVQGFVRAWKESGSSLTAKDTDVFCISAPSYQGNHREGYQRAIYGIIEHFLDKHCETELSEKTKTGPVCIIPGMVSPADLRWLKRMMQWTGLDYILLPDYSQSMDGGPWTEYRLLPSGGTKIEDLNRLSEVSAVIELGAMNLNQATPGELLCSRTKAELYSLPLPVGLAGTDAFLRVLTTLSGKELPQDIVLERGRLIDSYVDAHKIIFGKSVLLVLEEDLSLGFMRFCQEIGMEISAVVLSSNKRNLPAFGTVTVMFDGDFAKAEEAIENLRVDMIISSSKGFKLSQKISVPLLRAGFPVHDRYGSARILHFGYEGAQGFFDLIVNTFIAEKQAANPVGYTYF